MLDIRYVAGLFDGEGYVTIRKWSRKGSPCISYVLYGGINMTYRPLIEQLHTQFGGSFGVNRHDLRNPNQRACFHWILGNRQCAKFLQRIEPYTVVKHEEIQLCLQLQASIDQYRFKLGNHSRFHPERDRILAEREQLRLTVSQLKHRVFSPEIDSDPVQLIQ